MDGRAEADREKDITSPYEDRAGDGHRARPPLSRYWSVSKWLPCEPEAGPEATGWMDAVCGTCSCTSSLIGPEVKSRCLVMASTPEMEDMRGRK